MHSKIHYIGDSQAFCKCVPIRLYFIVELNHGMHVPTTLYNVKVLVNDILNNCTPTSSRASEKRNRACRGKPSNYNVPYAGTFFYLTARFRRLEFSSGWLDLLVISYCIVCCIGLNLINYIAYDGGHRN